MRFISKNVNNEYGFFLIEVLIVSFILMVAGYSFAIYHVIERERIMSETYVTASFLAHEQIAYAKSLSKASLKHNAHLDWLGDGASPIKMNNHEFYIETSIEPLENDLRMVRVNVSWKERGKQMEKDYKQIVDCHE